jgi:MFS family permease
MAGLGCRFHLIGGDIMTPKASTNWVHVALVMSTALCIGLTIGLFPALISINVDVMGYGTTWNGLLAAMHGLSGLIAGLIVPRLMATVGAMRTYTGAIAVAATMAVLFTVFRSLEAWFLLRFLMGLGLGVQWIVSETWMNQIAIGPRRGTIISLYVVVLSIGLSLGPMIMTQAGTTGSLPFLVTSGLVAVSFIPLLFLPPQDIPAKSGTRTLSFVAAARRKPSAMLAGALDGFMFQAMMAFFPIYFIRLGASEYEAVSMLNALFLGGIVMQVGAGYLIDRYSPAKVLTLSSLAIIIGLGAIAVRGLETDARWAIMFLMGGPAAAIYTAGLASVNDAFTADDMPSGTAAFTMIWHVGGLSGPVIAGAAMALWEPFGLTVTLALSLAVLALANLISLPGRRSRASSATD